MNRYSLLHATRSTPDRALATRSIWLDRAKHKGRIDHVFGIQSDDRESNRQFKARAAKFAESNPPPEWASSSVANWNAAAEIATGDWLIVIADDLIPPRGWDVDLDKETGPLPQHKPVAIQTPDGIANDNLLRHPIINRALYDQRGFVFDPDYYGVYCDNDLTLWCRKYADVYRAQRLRVSHIHPINGGRESDEICELQNSQQAYRYGAARFAEKWPETVPKFRHATHSVWIGDRLGLMERLTLNLLLRVGHRPTLWIRDGFDRSTVPAGVIVRTIPDDVMAPVRFGGKPHPTIPNGGIGSLAHWSDYFSACVLSVHGGVWVQLDIAITAPLGLPETSFTSWSGGLSPCLWNAPIGSEFARIWGAFAEDGVRTQFDGQDWHDCMHAIPKLLDHTRTIHGVIGDPYYFDCVGRAESPYNRPLHDDRIKLIHWSNATHGTSKETPTPGSYYETLCRECGLV
jgi:hypothetical protein